MIITIGFYLLMVFTLDMYFLSAYVDVTLVENSHELIRVRLFLVSYSIVHANTMPVIPID